MATKELTFPALDEDINTADDDVLREFEKHLEARALRLLDELEEIDLQMDKVIARRNLFQNCQQLIFTMPDEILDAIFLATITKSRRSRRTISHVCRQWRKLALANPRLWNTIMVEPHAIGREEELNDMLETYLKRSGDTPLDLYIREPYHQTAAFIRLFDLLSAYQSRWFALAVVIRSVHGLTEVETRLRSMNAPLLRRLSVTGFRAPPPSSDVTTFQEGPWNGAPLLRCIHLENIRQLAQARLPETVTVAHIGTTTASPSLHLTHEQLRDVLALPLLETLFVYGDVVDKYEGPFAPSRVVMHKLKNLRIGDSGVAFLEILKNMAAPHLESAVIESVLIQEFLDFGDVFFNVRHLDLWDCQMGQSTFWTLMSACINVRYLTLSGGNSVSRFVDGFGAEGYSMPKLETLALPARGPGEIKVIRAALAKPDLEERSRLPKLVLSHYAKKQLHLPDKETWSGYIEWPHNASATDHYSFDHLPHLSVRNHKVFSFISQASDTPKVESSPPPREEAAANTTTTTEPEPAPAGSSGTPDFVESVGPVIASDGGTQVSQG